MASLLTSSAAMSSEMLGKPVSLRGATRSAPSPSTPATFKTVALFSKKKAAPPPPKKKPAAVAPANDELAKWYGPDRRIFLPEGLLDRSEIPEYLTGECPEIMVMTRLVLARSQRTSPNIRRLS
ncbi:Chlorophyll a-b binding protein CP26 [Spatholobus suberectus]|nr:Chlorophyll a-b binding protein CP26 [Spatholobus suberectus]